MKCPKCGFVSFPGLAECKNCGHLFPENAASVVSAPSEPAHTPLISPRSDARTPTVPAEPESLTGTSRLSSVRDEPAELFSYPRAHDFRFDGSDSVEDRGNSIHAPGSPAVSHKDSDAASWQDELAGRVADFRHRRASVRGEAASGSTLEFDFERQDERLDSDHTDSGARESVDSFRTVRRRPRRDFHTPPLDSVPLRGTAPGADTAAGAIEAGEWALEPRAIGPGPVEVVLDTAPAVSNEPWDDLSRAPAAPLGLRLAAGLADALVLVSAVILFAVIFWKAGGSFRPSALDAASGLFIVGFLTFAYFALFSTLAFQTPGEAWMGLKIQSLNGGAPAAGESLWRAFGYVVSAAALMLGFVWILFDSEGLGWHDRMSRTYLVTAEDRRLESGAEFS